jgi:mono/diheme cytochrome c family protein
MRRSFAALLLAALPLLAGCDLSMTDQPRHETEKSDSLWEGGPEVQPAPPGTVALDAPARDEALKNAPPVTMAMLERGRERYAIYCTPCHGAQGRGDGAIVSRGFPRPRSFSDPALATMEPQHVVEAVTRGFGVMYDLADKVAPQDRWAIAAYVRALQRADADRQAAR